VREDRDILVVDKPAGLPCHPAGRFFNHTLWALLRARPESPNPQFVNRLDRETSGLVLLAKTPTAARNCCRQFAENKVAKTYLAIVEGEFPDTLRAQGRLAPDQTSLIRKKQRFLPADDGTKGTGKWGATAFRRRRCQAGLSLIEARPETGRHHQIRATLAALGFPVVGDKVYGPDECIFLRFREGTLTDSDRALLRLPRQALHASELALRHPVSGLTVHCQAQLPRDMVDLIAAAARGNCGYPCTS